MAQGRERTPCLTSQPTHSAALEQFAAEAGRQGVDFLLIDTAPQSDKPAINAAEAADLILIVCKALGDGPAGYPEHPSAD